MNPMSGISLTHLWPVFLALTGIQSLATAQSDPASDEGFVKIFNGENFDGWYLKIRSGDEEQARKVFTAGNGVIHVFNEQFPQEFELNTGKNDTHGLFYTKKKYSRYILRFEYKWGKRIGNNFDMWQYDAGCYYHVTDDKIWPKGIEYQIRFNHTNNRNHTGDFWVSGETLDWSSAPEGSTFLMTADGGVAMPGKKDELLGHPKAAFHALDGQWNRCEVIVMGNLYAIHKLNGTIVNIGTNLSVGEGIIGFQSETAEIFYRNIAIKEFAETVPLENFTK